MTILISGGGIGGLGAAIALSQRGIASHILEQAETFSEVGAGIQIGPNGMRILEHWGVAELLMGKGSTPEAIRIFDGLTGKMLNSVPLGEFSLERYGAPYRVFHRAELQMALLEKARSLSNITITTGFRIRKFVEHDNEVNVHCVSGNKQQGRLLIGADGLWSRTRGQMHPAITPTFYGKSAWRAIISRADAPEPFKRQETGLWMAPNAHLVHYPVMGGEAINVVAVITEEFNKEGWTTHGHSDELLAHYTNWNSVPRNFLDHVTGWQKWSLFGLEHIPFWNRGRVTLLGDAAHPPIPFLAQGGVMAIEDAHVLARELDLHGDDHAKAFAEYQSQRRSRAYHVMDTAHKLGKIYHMKGLMRQARNAVLTRKRPEKLLADYDWLYGFEFETIS
jgi:salicylate hydroxylase